MYKVISTCLFGSSPRAYTKYARHAPRSAKFLQQHLPDWFFRLYYDDTAPKDIIQALSIMGNVQLIKKPIAKGRAGCFWRYEAFDDCEVTVCRDLDFILQENDLISIKEWLKTDYTVCKSWIAHDRQGAFNRKNRRYYMAGMIGAKGLPFNTASLIEKYISANFNHPTDAAHLFAADEYFLTDYFIPEVYKTAANILIYIEPRCKGKVEIFPEKEIYKYYLADYKGMS